VAGELGTAVKTIKAHRAQVMMKMEVTSLAQLVHIVDRVDVLSAGDNRPSA
jgi:FixJ family two-component response regulator